MTSTPESLIAKQSPEQLKYSNELSAILSRQLTPETIDTYASDALGDLIGLVSDVTDIYAQSHQSEMSFDSHRQMEDAAFTVYGLDDIESILDHVADMTQEINQIDAVISNAESINRVIVPADLSNFRAEGDGGQFKEHINIPRLKTLLFVLSNDFGIDINDRAQLQITKGQNDPTMMRKESYHMVDVPDLDRLIMVCDEEGNATYIFDKSVINENNLNDIDLINYSKANLNNLIDEYPNVGKRIVYNKNYIKNIKTNIDNPLDGSNNNILDSKGNSYLLKVPKAPEDYASITSISRNLRSGPEKTNEAITLAKTKYGEAFGEVNRYKFGKRTADAYSPEQQAMIEACMDVAPKAPEGYVSIASMSINLRSKKAYEAIDLAIIKYGEAFGVVNKYKFGSYTTDGYSPEQQAMIESCMDIKPKAPEGYVSAVYISKNLHSTKIDEAVELSRSKYGEAFGIVNRYRFGKRTADGYSSEQQAMIESCIKDAAPKAPENYESFASMLKGLSHTDKAKAVALAKTKYGEAFGEVNEYKFKTTTTEGYSPEQQSMIESCMDITPEAPENYVAVASMSVNGNFEKTNEAIKLAKIKYGEAFGKVNRYKFGKTTTYGYSPEQQAMIEVCIIPKAPENYASVASMTVNLHYTKVDEAIALAKSEYGEAFGTVNEFYFGSKTADGYSPEQQAMIEACINRAPKAPEGYMSAGFMIKNLHYAKINEVIDLARFKYCETFGVVNKYRFGAFTTDGYSPEQQAMIENCLNDIKQRKKIGNLALSKANLEVL